MEIRIKIKVKNDAVTSLAQAAKLADVLEFSVHGTMKQTVFADEYEIEVEEYYGEETCV
jgi:hypothetical protein